MGFDQDGRHGERVVEVDERALRELGAGIQHGCKFRSSLKAWQSHSQFTPRLEKSLTRKPSSHSTAK